MEDGDTSAHLKSDDKTPATNTSASTQPPPEENIVKPPTSGPPVIQSLGQADKSSESGSQTGTSPSQASSNSSSRNVSSAATVAGKPNSHNLRTGNLNGPKVIPKNPYAKDKHSQASDEGTLYPQPTRQLIAKTVKAILLKKNNARPHIHRYTLRLETIKEKSKEEGRQIVKDTLQQFLEIVLQVDPKTIIPPYLELDRNDKSVSDISAAFPVSSVDSYHVIKMYFFRLSNRDESGMRWCSLILAQSIPFSTFMDKAKSSLENNEFSLWPKASDNENTTDVGWLLYSTRAQDEERLLSLLSRLTGENLRVKWKPIRANNANIKKKDQPAEEKVKALHVECAVERLQEIKDKLNHWYSSSFTRFPDGTKMRLVPTISSVTSLDNRVKFASCLARQAALTAGLASTATREISTNLLLEKKDPSTNKSFRQILMEITPDKKPGSTLFFYY